MFTADRTAQIRIWCTDFNIDLDAPARRGAAYRYSYLRIAQRVLLASGERLGLLTNGVELRLLISDPARPDSQVTIALDPNWKRSRNVPDSYRLVLALASPAGIKALPDLVDKGAASAGTGNERTAGTGASGGAVVCSGGVGSSGESGEAG